MEWVVIALIVFILVLLYTILYFAYKNNKKNNQENADINKKMDKIIGPIAMLLLLIAVNLLFFSGLIYSGDGSMSMLVAMGGLFLIAFVLSIIGIIVGYIKRIDYSISLKAFVICLFPITLYGVFALVGLLGELKLFG